MHMYMSRSIWRASCLVLRVFRWALIRSGESDDGLARVLQVFVAGEIA